MQGPPKLAQQRRGRKPAVEARMNSSMRQAVVLNAASTAPFRARLRLHPARAETEPERPVTGQTR